MQSRILPVALAALILTSAAVPVAAQAQRDALEDADRATLLAMLAPLLPDAAQSAIEAASADTVPANATGSGDAASDPADETAETRPICDPQTSDCTDCKGEGCGADSDRDPAEVRPVCDPRTDDCAPSCQGRDCVPDPCTFVPCDPPCVQDPTRCADLGDRFRVRHAGNVCENGECVPPPCDLVDCDPDPPCQKDVERCTDRNIQGRTLCDPRVGDCTPCSSGGCVPEVVADAIAFTVVHPDSVFGPAAGADAADPFTVDGHVRNELPVPVALSVEAASETPGVCEVSGFGTDTDAQQVPPGTSATGQEVRQRNYVLAPNGSQINANVPNSNVRRDPARDVMVQTPVDDASTVRVGETAVSFSAAVTPVGVGACTVRYDAVVQTRAGDVMVDSYRGSTQSEEGPGTGLDLGRVEIDPDERGCTGLDPTRARDRTVEAGEVGVEAIIDWDSACSSVDDRWAVLNLSYKRDGADAWRNLSGAHLGNPGTATVEDEVHLEEGEYTFRMQSAYFEGGFTISCLFAMRDAAQKTFILSVVVALLLGGPVAAALIAAAVTAGFAALGAWWEDDECHQQMLDRDTRKVHVEAVGEGTDDPSGSICAPLDEVPVDAGWSTSREMCVGAG